MAAGDTSARVAFASSDGDLQQLTGDLNTMIERLVGLAAAQDRFVANAAHELRTPLTALRIELEHALKSAHDLDDAQTAMRGALDSGRRLSKLADELLVVARARAAKRTQGEICGVRECVDDAVNYVRSIAEARQVRIELAPMTTVLVWGERAGISRIVRNLLENAVRHSPSGERVRVVSELDGDTLRLAIEDHGGGVDPRDHARVFEPFERLERDDAGAGLGLSIARSLAHAFGGDVEIDAKYTEGARFVLRLRVQSASRAPAGEATAA